MEEQMKKAFEVAVELSKQLLTLSTGIVALTITFREKVANNTPRSMNILGAAWLLYLVSIACGIWHLMALTGSLAASTKASLDGFNVRLPAALEIVSFLGGTLLITFYGVKAVRSHN